MSFEKPINFFIKRIFQSVDLVIESNFHIHVRDSFLAERSFRKLPCSMSPTADISLIFTLRLSLIPRSVPIILDWIN